MVSRREIKKRIDATEERFLECWDVLYTLRVATEASDQVAHAIIGFQERLAEPLFELEICRTQLNKEKRRLVSGKARLNSQWFSRRMRTLSAYDKALNGAIAIGKALGDAFAWFFYKKEREFLSQHLSRPMVFHVPCGVGGRAELEFIRKVKQIEGRFVLHHATTTILRLGDFSLFDLKTMRLIAIGEMKSRRADEDTIESLISFTAVDPSVFQDMNHSSAGPTWNPVPLREAFPADILAGLRRQLKSTAETFKEVYGRVDKRKISMQMDWPISDLERLVAEFSGKRLAWRQVGSSLVLLAYRLGHRRLFGGLLNNRPPKFGNEVVDPAVSIVSGTPKRFNSLTISVILYDGKNGEPTLPHGMIPLFWWPLDLAFLKSVYLRQVALVSIFNPAHILCRLEKMGFTVTADYSRRLFQAEKTIGKGILSVGESLPYMFHLVASHLFDEDAVISIFEQAMEKTAQGMTGNAKIELEIIREFADNGMPSQD